MSQVQFIYAKNEDGAAITVFVPGHAPLPATSDHPNFDRIVELAEAKDASVVDLFDVAQTITTTFERLSERITVSNDNVYLDGDVLTGTLVDHILRTLAEGSDPSSLVKFYENLLSNPNKHSVDNLFRWIEAMGQGFTITDEGMIIGYKGVQVTDDGFASISSGKALVNDVVHTGQIPQKEGDVVTMPRSEVEHDPSVPCHVGLHVGTFRYAQSFSRGAVLEVIVNPRDVVSVPTDSSGEKMRCCRYEVIGVIDTPYTQAVVSRTNDDSDYGWGDGEDDICEDCGAYIEDCECDEFEAVESYEGVSVGDVFKDADKREQNRTLVVEGFTNGGTVAITRSSTGVRRNVKVSRLNRNKYYRRVGV